MLFECDVKPEIYKWVSEAARVKTVLFAFQPSIETIQQLQSKEVVMLKQKLQENYL